MYDDTDRLHFVLPPELRQFRLFSKLPYDLRYKLWESIIYTPGIHFVRFERNEAWTWNPEDESRDDSELPASDDAGGVSSNPHRHYCSNYHRNKPFPKIERSTQYSATLKPIFDTPHGDTSYYHTAFKTMTTLWYTCEEARDMVYRATNQRGVLSFDDGTLISLANSADIICIDYPEQLMTWGLGSWAKQLNPKQLTRIRRVAVRYQPDWDEMRRYCHLCGAYHDRGGGYHDAGNDRAKARRPRSHLYEFAALFPNLEAFYFLDHMIVRSASNHRKQPCHKVGEEHDENADDWRLAPNGRARTLECIYPGGGVNRKGERFRSTDRSYFEMDHDLYSIYKVQSNVFQMLEWVREKYVAHCEKQPVEKKTHPDPRSVRFSVLGCEWDQDGLVAEKKRTTTKDEMPLLQQLRTVKTQKRNRLRGPEYYQVRQHQERDRLPTNVNPLEIAATTVAMDQLVLSERTENEDHNTSTVQPTVFGNKSKDKFPFTFRVSLQRAMAYVSGDVASHSAVWYI